VGPRLFWCRVKLKITKQKVMKQMRDIIHNSKTLFALLLIIGTTQSVFAQIPNPPPPNTNNPPPFTNGTPPVVTGNGAGFLTTNGPEYVLANTLPSSPDPTQSLPSWATIDPGGLTVDTNGFIVESGNTNGVPGDMTGMDAGFAVGVVVGSTNTVFTLTRGEFYVLLTNTSGELANTRFEIKIMRNTGDFTELFAQEMALAEYQTNISGLTLTPISGVANLYDMQVQFPANVIAAPRVVSIRTEPLDTQSPFAELQWLYGTGNVNSPTTYTTDNTFSNLAQVAGVPAMKLWAAPIAGAGLGTATCLTANQLNLFAIPGTVIQSSSVPNSGFTDYVTPDEYGFADADMSQAPSWFYTLRLDTTP
jgi:hypothetical protein